MRRSARSMDRLKRLQPALWVLAVAFFGVGDLVTTVIGLQTSGVVEAGPVVGPLVDRYGVAGISLVKLGTIAGSYAVWRLVPSPHRIGVPLGLAVVGIAVTGWNTVVVSTALVC